MGGIKRRARYGTMGIIESLKQRAVQLLTAPGDELGRWARFLRFQIQLWRHCVRRLRANNVLAMSSALSFLTLFALIPTLVLGAIVLKSVGGLEDSRKSIRKLLESGGLNKIALAAGRPATATGPAGGASTRPDKVVTVADKIESLVADVAGKLSLGVVGLVGAVLLIWSALWLLMTIERSLNRIFGARRSRPLGRRVLLYWAVVTLSPILLAVADWLGQEVAEVFRQVPILSWMLAAFGWAGPIVVAVLLLAALYKWMPNTTVGFREAIGGAVVAVPLWLLAKLGFSLYVRELVGWGSLYGTLGLLPLFLIWLNLSWTILLFGAELSHAAANVAGGMRAPRPIDRTEPDWWDPLAAAIAISQPYIAGEGPVRLERIAAILGLSRESAQEQMARLVSAGIACAAADGAYVPARPVEGIRLLEVLRISGPKRLGSPRSAADAEIAEAVAQVRRQAEATIENLTLADVLHKERKSG